VNRRDGIEEDLVPDQTKVCVRNTGNHRKPRAYPWSQTVGAPLGVGATWQGNGSERGEGIGSKKRKGEFRACRIESGRGKHESFEGYMA
jgi:hypothetical protein